jgi:chromatin structure-remodeling complex subunit SFH1
MTAFAPSGAPRLNAPQSFISTYAPRIRTRGNSLLAPVLPTQGATGAGVGSSNTRMTKRGTTAINYAEDAYDDDDFLATEDGEERMSRRLTGLRSLRRDDSMSNVKAVDSEHQDRDIMDTGPVEVQGIWRGWMNQPRRVPYVSFLCPPIHANQMRSTQKQCQTQAHLPVTLIPIRIDLDIQSFRPEAALPLPMNPTALGVDESLPVYRTGDPTPQFRLKDMFLWNLHESLTTPEQFARVLIEELDFPPEKREAMIRQVSQQIRSQLEEYAGLALHPLFSTSGPSPAPQAKLNGTTQANGTSAQAQGTNGVANGTQPNSTAATPKVDTPEPAVSTPVEAVAEQPPLSKADALLNPDDTYRCIVTLNVNIMNRLYSDKFEWSLTHPPGTAELFARQTCADLGLAAEWVPAIAHAIYEAVLRLRKEVCENNALLGYADMLDNDGAEGVEAGWRYEPERLAEEWEPKVEVLSKEEIDRREGDRERQIRRQRRETARFSTSANMGFGTSTPSDYFANPDPADVSMGRGERIKKKRRFRSISPEGGRGTPDVAGGDAGPLLQEW